MLEEWIRQHKIIAILRKVPPESTENYLDALYRGGIRLVEVALNSPGALGQIEWIRSRYDGKMRVGGGTALTPDGAQDAVRAGAEFLLSPSVCPDVLEYCRKKNIPLLPGVMTPSDVSACLRFGYRTLKLFPAGDLPAGYIKSLKGPFSQTEYVAVGGVNAENIGEFFRRGFIGAGMGSNLFPGGLVEQGRWEEARAFIAGLLGKVSAPEKRAAP